MYIQIQCILTAFALCLSSECTKKSALLFIGHPNLKHLSDLMNGPTIGEK